MYNQLKKLQHEREEQADQIETLTAQLMEAESRLKEVIHITKIYCPENKTFNQVRLIMLEISDCWTDCRIQNGAKMKKIRFERSCVKKRIFLRKLVSNCKQKLKSGTLVVLCESKFLL